MNRMLIVFVYMPAIILALAWLYIHLGGDES